ncbi:MAG: hypothetical protein AAGF20_08575 [Pseudomonadota bacterium]
MKYGRSTLLAASLVVAGCSGGGSEVGAVDPYPSLGSDTLLVRFEANPDIAAGACNPKVLYAMRSSEEAVRINATYVVNKADLIGTGFSIRPSDTPGILSATEDLSMFDPLEGACSDIALELQEITCAIDISDDAAPCPRLQFEGTEIFASFRE